MAITDFFATPLWSKVAENSELINQELLELTRKLMKLDKKGKSKTNAGGWQSNFLSTDDIPLLVAFIGSILDDIKQDLNIKSDVSIHLNGCWINVNNKNNYNRTHTHPGNMLSGCYYIKTPKKSGDIVFEDPRAQAVCLPLPVVEKNKYTIQTARFHPESGAIVVFPSWLPHNVETNESDKERISVAFNMVFNEK